MDARDNPPAARPDAGSRAARQRPSGALLFVLVISALVMALAVLVVVWMYWLGGVVPG